MIRPVLAILVLLLACCNGDEAPVQGYVEGDYVRVGLPAGGRVTAVAVAKGQRVRQGEPLFTLDDDEERAVVAEARARLAQAEAQRQDLLTGKRALELEAIAAQKGQAEASLKLSQLQLARQEQLLRGGNTPPAAVDAARAALDHDRALVTELAADLAFGREGGRSAAIAAAEAAASAAAAALAQAEWRLAQRRAEAPADASVEDVLLRAGEFAASGQPVVSLLPPANLLIRFYLGPKEVGRLAPGQALALSCEGCPGDLKARVSFIARDASYAPPVIYSREQRDKLVFLVEARPLAAADRLHPGQPVSLILPAVGSASP